MPSTFTSELSSVERCGATRRTHKIDNALPRDVCSPGPRSKPHNLPGWRVNELSKRSLLCHVISFIIQLQLPKTFALIIRSNRTPVTCFARVEQVFVDSDCRSSLSSGRNEPLSLDQLKALIRRRELFRSLISNNRSSR